MAFRYLFAWAVAITLVATHAVASEPESWQGEPQQNPYAQQLLAPEFFIGTPVLDPQELPVGVVEQVVLDAEKGQIAYLVVKSNGFWGTLDQTALVPWQAVRIQRGEDPRVLLQVSAGKLEGAPMTQEALRDRPQEERIHLYYGVAPYWEDGQTEEVERDVHPVERLQQPMLQGGEYLIGEEPDPTETEGEAH